MGQRDVRKPFVTFHSFISFVLTSTAALRPPTSVHATVHATDVIYTRPPTSVAIECKKTLYTILFSLIPIATSYQCDYRI